LALPALKTLALPALKTLALPALKTLALPASEEWNAVWRANGATLYG
jgi:hypothetical protein